MQAAKRWTVKTVRPLLANLTYVARRGLIKGMRRKGGFSFMPGGTPTAEEKFLRDLDLMGLTVYDVGGWEGVYTMFFARAVGHAGRVVTFEPNPTNRDRISANVGLNGLANVVLRPVALGSSSGQATLIVEAGVSGEGRVQTAADGSAPSGDAVVPVQVEPLDREIATNGLPPPDFIKIDVEGFEIDVLQGMSSTIATHRPRIFVEVHQLSERPANSNEVITFLLAAGYSLLHVESGSRVVTSNHALAHSDHLYCE